MASRAAFCAGRRVGAVRCAAFPGGSRWAVMAPRVAVAAVGAVPCAASSAARRWWFGVLRGAASCEPQRGSPHSAGRRPAPVRRSAAGARRFV